MLWDIYRNVTLLNQEETVNPGMPLQICLYQLFLYLAFFIFFFLVIQNYRNHVVGGFVG